MRAPGPMRTSPVTPGRPDGYPRSTPGSTTDPAPSRTSTAPGRSHFNGGSFRAHRFFDRDERLHDAEPEAGGGERRPSARHGVDELRALILQRLAGLDLRADDVAVADEQFELAVGVGDRAADRDAP